jgi:aminoglycoside phosphotransferase (APT) family kinase protein
MVIKIYQFGKGRETFDNMTRLWESRFGEHRSPPGLPRPVAFFEGSNVLVMERLNGYPMVEQMAPGLDRLPELAGTLADLHSSEAVFARRRDAKRTVRSIERKVADLAGLEVEKRFVRVTSRLLERLPEASSSASHAPVELVPSHGDFSPRNILVSSRSIAFIDWDRCQLADPARDLAYFGAWCWVMELSTGRRPDWKSGDELIDQYQTIRPVPGLMDRIGFYRAVGLARIAHSRIHLWKSEQWVASILEEALRWLA